MVLTFSRTLFSPSFSLFILAALIFPLGSASERVKSSAFIWMGILCLLGMSAHLMIVSCDLCTGHNGLARADTSFREGLWNHLDKAYANQYSLFHPRRRKLDWTKQIVLITGGTLSHSRSLASLGGHWAGRLIG